MPFVIDASITASWLFPDENFTESGVAWERSATDEVLVPQHWWFEIRNAILVAERRGRLTQDTVSTIIGKLSLFPFQAMPLPPADDVFALARQYRLTFYDAAYLELARRERAPIATLDLDLAAAARAEGVEIVE